MQGKAKIMSRNGCTSIASVGSSLLPLGRMSRKKSQPLPCQIFPDIQLAERLEMARCTLECQNRKVWFLFGIVALNMKPYHGVITHLDAARCRYLFCKSMCLICVRC